MNPEEKAAFAKANEKIHPVESQWHYPTMTKYNWVPITKSAIGFVRNYKYHKPDNPNYTILICTGVHADYFTDSNNKGRTIGFWDDLEPYLKTIK